MTSRFGTAATTRVDRNRRSTAGTTRVQSTSAAHFSLKSLPTSARAPSVATLSGGSFSRLQGPTFGALPFARAPSARSFGSGRFRFNSLLCFWRSASRRSEPRTSGPPEIQTGSSEVNERPGTRPGRPGRRPGRPGDGPKRPEKSGPSGLFRPEQALEIRTPEPRTTT